MQNKIRQYRIALGLTQEELAEKADISRTTLSKLESGERVVTKTDTLQKLSDVIGKSVSDIFFD